jgi:predicted MFS family arabinose efflux permease
LVAARFATGAFGGILGGMSMAIIGDVFPENRRGSAMGSLMVGFALASVAGVPLGLSVGTAYGWHVPFIALAIAGFPTLALAPFAMPPLNAHIGKTHTHPIKSIIEIFSDVNHLNAFALITLLMAGSFTLFPMLNPYLVANVGMTEKQLPFMYIAGGLLTLVTAPIVGRLADRYGKLPVYCTIVPGSAFLMLLISHLPPEPPRIVLQIVVPIFGALMMCNVGRMIAAMAMVTGSVEPRRRGAFLSINSSVQHLASGFGAYLGGAIVSKAPDGTIVGFE